MNLFGLSGITPDPNIKPIPIWFRACFWALGAVIAFGWMSLRQGSSDGLAMLRTFIEMFGVVFVAALVAFPHMLINLGGVIMVIARKPEAARRIFSYALRWNPSNESTYLNRGYTCFRLGDYPACISNLSRVLEIKPRHFHALFHRGMSFYMLESHEKAMQDLREAIQIKPKNFTTRVNLANTYLDSERYEEAREHYEIALQQKPTHFVALANIGATYSDEGNQERAIEYYDRALALYESPFVYCNRGLAHFLLGNEQQAEADFARGFEDRRRENVLGGDELRYKLRGQYRLMKGDIDGALDDLQKANELLPSRKETLAGLAAAHLMSGHTDAARNFWNLLMERDPRFADIAFVERRMQWPDTILDQVKTLMN